MGGHNVPPEVVRQSIDLGAAIAKRGWVLLTGGRSQGIMQGATDGARSAGGLTIGLHPGLHDADDVADADVVIFTGIGYARNMINILTSDVVVCLPGATGTLSEAAYATTYGKPLILFGFDDRGILEDAVRVDTLDACIEAIAEALP